MKKCELCYSLAKMYCESDQASLCFDCDAKVHSANFLVAKHSRTLLCHLCQSSTPWTATGPKLSPTFSVCNNCVTDSNCRQESHNGNDGNGHNDDDRNDTDDDSDGDGDDENGGDDDEENQVVPWSSSAAPPPASSSNSDQESSECSHISRKAFSLKRFRETPSPVSQGYNSNGLDFLGINSNSRPLKNQKQGDTES